MMTKILFLTSSHHFDDDRIFFHQATELKKNGFNVKICSLSSDYQGSKNEILVESFSVLEHSAAQKIQIFKNVVKAFKPTCIICSEPIAVIACRIFAKSHNVKVIYDVTEWYPSKRMVAPYSFPWNIIQAVKFFLINLYAGYLSDRFIFGEETKKFPLAFFFPFKKSIVLPYYPDSKYISQNKKNFDPNHITLCYTGQFSEEKGIVNFFNVVKCLKNKKPEIRISVLLVGGTRSEKDAQFFSQLGNEYPIENLSIIKSTSFEQFTDSFADADICFDLRKVSLENHNCLPIKIFYYAGAAKPVIYTNLKATREQVDVSKFGYLVNPEDADQIAEYIVRYTDNPNLYAEHAQNARFEFENKYNWSIIKKKFLNFVVESCR